MKSLKFYAIIAVVAIAAVYLWNNYAAPKVGFKA